MNELARMLTQRIRAEGPITVADYMAAATRRYYGSHDPLGTRGDFVTAPEISQMFGELIGLWCVETWRAMGAPTNFVLAELGPGRGTLMRDALRAARLAPEFVAAARLHLVEISPTLRDRQAAALADYAPCWHDRAEQLSDGPTILVANEFLDALPVRQCVRDEAGWHERRVGVADEGFVFMLDPAIRAGAADAPLGAVRETCPEALALADWLGRRVARQGGAALLIDYGYASGGFGDSLQALQAHRRADVLTDPGDADLTAHVDFAAIAARAEAAGARTRGPVEQGRFLRTLGIDARAVCLMANASERDSLTIAAGHRRLVDPEAMGSLFKVVAIADPALPPPAGFEEA
jgi:NADH dehydrogenase [ubiquinone] 1 alpha subcomplex assembly factor 7